MGQRGDGAVSFSFTNSLDGSFTIGGSSVQASYPDRLARGEPNAIKIWARTTTAGSGVTINDLKIKTPGLAEPTVFAGTSITVSNSPGNEFRELIIAGIDFQSLSSGEVTLEGSATMQFGSQPAPRGSSLQFHVIAAHIRDDVTITATNAIASEDPSLGPDRGEFVISRGEGNVTGDLQVAIRVPATVPAPLSIASLGADYTLSVGGAPISLSASGEGTVTIPAGKSSVSIRLAVEPDAILEWDETARVELLPAPTGSQPYGIVPNRGSADVTILDDELLGGMLSRNVDGESTGLSASTVGLGAATIDLAQGEATVSLLLVLGGWEKADSHVTATKSGEIAGLPMSVTATFSTDRPQRERRRLHLRRQGRRRRRRRDRVDHDTGEPAPGVSLRRHVARVDRGLCGTGDERVGRRREPHADHRARSGVESAGGIVTSFRYAGPVQRLDSVTDPEGQTTRLGYDTDFVHPCE